jgi:pimeloyl-ACP methyl ester carboxylesterase
MAIDVNRLRGLATFTDPTLGITERFFDLPLRSGGTLGVLSRSIEERPGRVAWLMCHSFGPEQANLSSADVSIARRVAASGDPVLRFHCQGYGDSERSDFVPTIDSHVEDTVDAARLLRDITDIGSIGLIGTKVGGAIALLAAAQLDVEYLALVAPVVRGRRFMRELVRARTIIELTGSADQVGAEDPWAILNNGGSVRVRGSLITPENFRAFDSLDLGRAGWFHGAALLVQVSAGSELRADIRTLSEALRGAGSSVTTSTVTDHTAAMFGERNFRPAGDGSNMLVDITASLSKEVSRSVATWAGSGPGSAATSPADAGEA